MIVPGMSKLALHLYNRVGIAVAISVVVVPVVSVRIVPVIGIRIEERESKRVDKDERSIVVETAEAIAGKPIRARHGAIRREPRCWRRHRGSRHHWRRMHGCGCNGSSQAQRR